MIPSDDHPFIVLAETKLGISPLQSPKEEQEQGTRRRSGGGGGGGGEMMLFIWYAIHSN